MGIELFLQRVAEDDAPADADALDRHAAVAREVLEDDEAVDLSPDGDALWCELPGGTATLDATSGTIPLDDLDDETMWFTYEVAKRCDMAIWLDGEPNIILTDPSQRKRVPKSWLNPGQRPPVVKSCAELTDLLDDIFGDFDQGRPAHQPVPGSPTDDPAPGSTPGSSREYAYIQISESERVASAFDRFCRYSRQAMREGRLENAGFFGLMAYEIRTPAGMRMFAPLICAKPEFRDPKWVDLIREWCEADGRVLGLVENHDTLVLSTGRRIALSECRVFHSK